MLSKKLKPATIEDYILSAPENTQEKLWQMHYCITKAAPGATENLKWNVPAYSYKRILVTFAVFKNHIGFFPTPLVVKAFAKELAKYKTASASVQFPLAEKLPLPLITKMVKYRVKQSLQEDAKWKE